MKLTRAQQQHAASAGSGTDIVLHGQESSDAVCALVMLVLLAKQDPEQQWTALTAAESTRQPVRCAQGLLPATQASCLPCRRHDAIASTLLRLVQPDWAAWACG